MGDNQADRLKIGCCGGNMGGFKNFLQLFRLDLLNSFLFLLWLQINH